MGIFSEAFSPMSKEKEIAYNEMLNEMDTLITKECLELGYTKKEIEDAYSAFEKDYEGRPNFVYRPLMTEYMKYQYYDSPNRTVFESGINFERRL